MSVGKRPRVLVIVDVDGTLLRNGDALRVEFHRAFLELTGVDISNLQVMFAGSTDRFIVRQFIEHGGIAGDYEALFEAISDRFCELVARSYPTHPAPRMLPGVRELLEAVQQHPEAALVLGTGNIRRSCEIKLQRFDLLKYFAHGGGFGGDFESRSDVIRTAIDIGRDQCGWLGEAWVVGDTPNDVSAAHDAGARALAVGTGMVSVERLRETGAEAVLPDLCDTAGVLEILGLGS